MNYGMFMHYKIIHLQYRFRKDIVFLLQLKLNACYKLGNRSKVTSMQLNSSTRYLQLKEIGKVLSKPVLQALNFMICEEIFLFPVIVCTNFLFTLWNVITVKLRFVMCENFILLKVNVLFTDKSN